MVRKFIIAIAATAALGAALSPTGALAARWGGCGFSGPHFSQGWGRGDIRAAGTCERIASTLDATVGISRGTGRMCVAI
jgi:hypothetical protein